MTKLVLSSFIKQGNLEFPEVDKIFKAINEAAKKSPNTKNYFVDRASTIKSVQDLKNLVAQLDTGVEFVDEACNE